MQKNWLGTTDSTQKKIHWTPLAQDISKKLTCQTKPSFFADILGHGGWINLFFYIECLVPKRFF